MLTEPQDLPQSNPVKLIRQEKVIRLSGVIMMISPFVNFALSIAPVQNVGDKTSLPVLLHLAKSINSIHWFLWGASFVVGLMMLKGRRSSWISVLAILGIFIVFDCLNLKKNLARGWEQPLISIAFNLAIFVLVYAQEFRQSSQPRPKAEAKPAPPAKPIEKPKPKGPHPIVAWMKTVKVPEIKLPEVKMPELKLPDVKLAKPETKPVPVATRAPIFNSKAHQNLVGFVIHFDGMGPWARIINLSDNELFIEAFKDPPPHLAKRAVEIDIGQQTYRMQMTTRQGKLYTFRFQTVEKAKLRLVS